MLEAFAKRKKYGYSLASNGLEAFNLFKISLIPFDFVLMDISMPVMDGITAARHIREHEQEVFALLSRPVDVDAETRSDSASLSARRFTKIIALTGLASQEAKQEAFASGIDMFITKPVRLAELNRIFEGAGDDRFNCCFVVPSVLTLLH